MIEARKIPFQEAWNSSTIFFVDKELEQEIKAQVESLLETAQNHRVSETTEISILMAKEMGNMSSFQETTSSGQTTKAKDMRSAYEQICHLNSRYGENRVFVNFVDGGGWLARRRDLERLVEHCHYFVNLQHLDMLEAIVLKHMPERCFAREPA